MAATKKTNSNLHVFRLAELYILVWAWPAQQLAPFFAMSDRGLNKKLVAAGIEFPGRDIWAKYEHQQFIEYPVVSDERLGEMMALKVAEGFSLDFLMNAGERRDFVERARRGIVEGQSPQSISRSTLYSLVWAHRQDTLADALGVSVTLLRRVCRDERVPMPRWRDRSNVRIGAKAPPLRGDVSTIALRVSREVDLTILLKSASPRTAFESLKPVESGPAITQLLDSWFRSRADVRNATKVGAAHALKIYGMSNASTGELETFFQSFSSEPYSSIRRRAAAAEYSDQHAVEVTTSLMSLIRHYGKRDSRPVASRKGTRSDGLDPGERRLLMETFLFALKQRVEGQDWRHARDVAMFTLMAQASLPITALCKLKRANLDLFAGRVTLREVDGKNETWELTGDAVAALSQYGRQRPETRDESVFLNASGAGITREGIRDAFSNRLREVGMIFTLQLKALIP